MAEFDAFVHNDSIEKGRERLSSQTYVVGHSEDVIKPDRQREFITDVRFASNADYQHHTPLSTSSGEEESVSLAELPLPFHVPPRHRQEKSSEKSSEGVGLVPRSVVPDLQSPTPTEAPEAHSLGQQIMIMAEKARQVEREKNSVNQENEKLKGKCGRQAQEIERLSGTIHFLEGELRSRFHVKLKEKCHSEKVTSSAGHVGEQISQSNNMEPNNNSEKEISSSGKDVRPCAFCQKLLKRERTETRIQLEREKQKNKNLELKLISSQRHLQRLQYNIQNPSRPSENFTSQDKMVQDLLTEISVLQQQMVVVVEDFEKERTDRARAVSSCHKLKEKFESLTEKVRTLKRQLVLAHSRLTDFVASNNELQSTVQQLQSELRTKDERLSHLLLTTGNSYNRIINVPAMYVPTQHTASHYMNNSNYVPNVEKWSCVSCTYVNSGQRTVCEMCGKVNNLHSPSLYATGDISDCVRPLQRSCRLVSRGLSTDEGLADLAIQESAFDFSTVPCQPSHSM